MEVGGSAPARGGASVVLGQIELVGGDHRNRGNPGSRNQARTILVDWVIAYGGIGLPIGYMLCFKTRFGTYGLWTGLTLALVVAAGLVPAFWLRDPKAT
jgi:hypothetical protein